MTIKTVQVRRGERGSALILALFLLVVLTVVGLGLLLRTRVTMAVAGAERPMTKNFYAADSGIHAGYARLQVNNPCPFQFVMADARTVEGSAPVAGGYDIQVNVAQSVQIGFRREIGAEAGGGLAGGGSSQVSSGYRMNSNTLEQATQSRRAIEAEVFTDPAPPAILPPCS